jgi:thiosulfate dehydrogenase (quinone) large subunit
VGIIAFFAAFMNWNYIMAGTASTNPLLLVGAIALILAWKIAGYYGADYFLLRYLGTPWRGHKVDEVKEPVEPVPSPGRA